MELVHGTRSKASKLPTEDHDVISRMPENVVTNILDRLPIRDAVRTGILAKNWRFKWTTMLSQLLFDERFFKHLLGAPGTINYDWKNVIIFLLHLKGVITKFVLCLPRHRVFDVEDINHWFLFLSGKGIKDVALRNIQETLLKLPAHLFSCLELKTLNLWNCCFHPPPSFRGFPNLLSLTFFQVRFENYKFGELIAHCPLLESLQFLIYGKVKPVEIAKLENLKELTMQLYNLDTRSLTSSRVFQLVGSLPKLQKLNLGFQSCEFLAEAGDTMGALATFPCLKTLILRFIDLTNDNMVSYVLKMIRCSPNLQNLKIMADFIYHVPPHALSSSGLDCNKMGMLQLRGVMFACNGSENEVYLIKFLLAHSPLLKKIAVGLHAPSMVDGRLEFAEKLLKFHRASPVAEIDLFYYNDLDKSSLFCHLQNHGKF